MPFSVPRSSPRKAWAIAAVASLLAGLLTVSPQANAAETHDITVLFTNDTHAHLDNVGRRWSAIQDIRRETPNTVLLDAGDVFSGTLYFNSYQGLADLEFMNAMGYDAMVPGNHEFDKGPAVLADFIEKAEFPIVSANVDYSEEPELSGFLKTELTAEAAGASIYPATVLEAGGEQYAVFGLTTPETAFLASPGKHIVFEAEIETAKATVADLTARGYDKIIALTHLGYSYDVALAEAVEGIDIIIGGHSHTRLDEAVVVEAFDAPTLIAQTGEYGSRLGRLDANFDEAGELTDWEYALIDLDAKNEAGEYLIQGDEAFEARLKELQGPLEEMKSTVVGKSDVALVGDRTQVRRGETNLGNLIANAVLHAAAPAGAEIAITNGGGIRASIDAGDITLGEVLTVMPFGNSMVTLDLTGAEIVEALENGVSTVEEGAGRFPQVAGLTFSYNLAKPAGERVSNVKVALEDGSYAPIDLDATYTVATNAYMADGGDNYAVFKKAKDEGRQTDLFVVDYDAFASYLATLESASPAVEGRITRVYADLGTDHPAHEAVQLLSTMNVFPELSAGGDRFLPKDSVTRLDAAVWLARALKLELPEAAAAFRDVPADHAFAQEVLAAKSEGIFLGMPDGRFGPIAALTKGQAALVLERAFGKAPSIAGDANAAITRGDFAILLYNAITE
ncbi:5'-nucleotidase C-terminal domain-containing protein [Paenibacillus sp.]|uniref:5'-nucleotidase C-terminal domain-containing protein n=1 Tax=Paenibacillus sp. TaxID=58172 RepID=UPI002D686C4F|nr:5'-nucleotidase C-terminal domain-containing protein [Paenibacillus sp.]HZG83339.1 5'-nucleotidase C-terminal domain-containing protein [Paenibacillus sp.]